MPSGMVSPLSITAFVAGFFLFFCGTALAKDDGAAVGGFPRAGDVRTNVRTVMGERRRQDGHLSPWNWDSRKVEGIRKGEVMLTFGEFDGVSRGRRYWLYRKIAGKPRLADVIEITSTQTHACRARSALGLVVPAVGDLVRDPVYVPDTHGHSMYYLESAEDYYLRGGYDLGYEQVLLALQLDRKNHRAAALAAVHLLRLGLSSDAGRTARRAVELCGAAVPPEPDYLAMANIAAGVAAYEKGDSREAVRFLSVAAGEAPVTRPRAWIGPIPGEIRNPVAPESSVNGSSGTVGAGNPRPSDWTADRSNDPGNGFLPEPLPADPSSVDRLRGIARVLKGLILRDEGYNAYSDLELKRARANPDSMREFGLFLNKEFRLFRIAGQVLGDDAFKGLSPGR